MSGVALDLFNEPHDISWSCRLSGCTTPGGWQAAGMQQLIDAVRGAGATQPVIVEGLGWGGDLSGWLANRPHDPAGQLVAGWHTYNFSGCSTSDCWNDTVAPVAAQLPVLATEVGENDCGGSYLNTLLPWADAHGIGYLAWAWNAASCSDGPSLISDYTGTATPYGAAYKLRISARVKQPPNRRERFDFEDGTLQGSGVRWGGTVSVSNETGIAWSGSHGLDLNVLGSGWPAVGTDTNLVGVGPGSVVTYRVWAPAAVSAGVSPMLFDLGWHALVLGNHNLLAGGIASRSRYPAGSAACASSVCRSTTERTG